VHFIGWAVLLTCLFVGATLFFSVNAIALRGFSRLRLQEAFKTADGEERPELVDAVTDNADRLSLACSFYRLVFNFCSLLLLMAILSTLQNHALSPGSYILVFFVALAIFSVFSLAIPHAWAKYAGEKLISRTYHLLMFFALLATPVLYILRLYDGFVRRLAGVPEVTPEEQLEEKHEEFLEDLEQHRMEGTFDEEEQEMIENVLELSESCADEIMTPRTDLVAIEVASDLPTVLEAIKKAGHSRIPVYEENIDNIVGFIYAKDLLAEIGKDPADFRLRDRMREAYFVPESKPLRALLHEFQNQKLHIAVVLDEYGGTAGIVTTELLLEEIVGALGDELRPREREFEALDERTVQVDGGMSIHDANEELDLGLPEGEYETVAGFVLSQLGHIPREGEKLSYNSLRLMITRMQGRKIERVLVTRL
jgi:putative hemolysin